jgi:phage shock protein PspC (stress-responsive transcriptional regulator)
MDDIDPDQDRPAPTDDSPRQAALPSGATTLGGDGGPPPTPSPHRLRRDMEHRMLGGVAAGTARYLDIDVVIVRVAFAALAILGGSGVLIYLAAWLLIPADDEDHPLAQQWAGRRPPHRSLMVIGLGIVFGVIALAVLFTNRPWLPDHEGGVGFTLGLVALVVALALVAGSGGNRSPVSRLRWLLLVSVLAVVGVVVVAAATVFSIEAASGVPLSGGIGDTQLHPTSAGQLAPNYRLAVGNLDLNLSDVAFQRGTTHITASVGIGRLLVEVPPGPTVSVVAHSGLGDVQVFGQSNGGLSTVRTMQSEGSGTAASRPHLVLNADAGVGQVQVVRTAPAFS